MRAVTGNGPLRALGADGRAAPLENQGFLRPDAYLVIVLQPSSLVMLVPLQSRCFLSTRSPAPRRSGLTNPHESRNESDRMDRL